MDGVMVRAHAGRDGLLQPDADADRARRGLPLRRRCAGPSTTRSAARPTSSIAHEAKSGTHFIETLRGMMAIKLNLRESGAPLGLSEPGRRPDQRRRARAERGASLQRAANALIFGIENVLVIWLGALPVMDGKFTVGMLFAFLAFKLLFLTRVNNLIDKSIEFRMLDLHAERIADIALAEPGSRSSARSRAGRRADGPLVLQAARLGFAYGSEGFVFRGVDLAVAAGRDGRDRRAVAAAARPRCQGADGLARPDRRHR